MTIPNSSNIVHIGQSGGDSAPSLSDGRLNDECARMRRRIEPFVHSRIEEITDTDALDHLVSCEGCWDHFQSLSQTAVLTSLAVSDARHELRAHKQTVRSIREKETGRGGSFRRDVVSYAGKEKQDQPIKRLIAKVVRDVILEVFFANQPEDSPVQQIVSRFQLPEYIPPCMWLDAGSSMSEVARALIETLQVECNRESNRTSRTTLMSIATHNEEAAKLFTDAGCVDGRVNVVTFGGKRDQQLNASFMPLALGGSRAYLPYGANIAVLATSGITEDGIWASGQADEFPMKRALLADLHMNLRILVVQDSKFGVRDAFRVCSLEELFDKSEAVVIVTNDVAVEENARRMYWKMRKALTKFFEDHVAENRGVLVFVKPTES